MGCYLSKSEISSFVGNVVSLKLGSEVDISKADIKWGCDSDILRVKEFVCTGDLKCNHGVLLSLDKVGEATVTAELDGTVYECAVKVREAKTAKRDDKFNFYRGDMHAHSSWNHKLNGEFTVREADFPADMVRSVVADGRLDFFTVSDHGSIMTPYDLFRTFDDVESNESDSVVIFPGSESECIENMFDEFGVERPESGEFVMINAADYIFEPTHAKSNEIISRNPHAIISIAHPTCYSTYWCRGKLGIPKFAGADAYPAWKKAVRMVEVGNGSDRGSTILFEVEYARALDYGFKVSPVSPSDSHGPPLEIPWGFDSWPGKTVILAPEKSREMFLDAMLNNRVYATESGNTALFYTVNGQLMGETVKDVKRYDFHVEIGDIDRDNPRTTVRCEVISDYGKKVKVIEGVDFSSFDFTVESDTARYFYLRIVDSEGLKTWSAPVWTGRDFDRDRHFDSVSYIDTTGFTATDASGADVSVIFSRNAQEFWRSENSTDTITVDMKREVSLRAVKLRAPEYDYMILRKENKEKNTGLREPDIRPIMAEFPAEYRISASLDGESYTVLGERLSASYGYGDTLYFDTVKARYLKVELLSTIGRYSCRPEYKDAKIGVGELQFIE